MRSFYRLLIFVTFSFMLLCLCCSRPPAPKQGDPAPDFTLSDKDGRRFSLSAMKGKVILLNFWSVFCPPCRKEMPSMERLYKKISNDNFSLLAVSVDANKWNDVEDFVKKTGISFAILFDPDGKTAKRYGTFKLPETYLIDKKGHIRMKFAGPRKWDDTLYINTIKNIINDSAS